jgi:hypothetical protein
MLKTITTGLALAALVVPAYAAATYWVVLDTSTHQCSIVEQDQKPSSPTIKVIGNGYASRDAAAGTVENAVACGHND